MQMFFGENFGGIFFCLANVLLVWVGVIFHDPRCEVGETPNSVKP